MEGIRWKFVSAISIIAMAVSLLSGGLAGISLGMLVMRALLGGVVFAVLAVGLNLFITRFFPELFEDDPGYGNDPDPAESGRNVDIVIPAESPGVSTAENEESGEPPGVGEVIEELVSRDGAEEPAAEAALSGENHAGAVGDLDRFSEDFMEVDGESDGSRPAAADVPGGDREPQEIAQAIHTVMKRDEKG
jgi:hypothetical protein